MSHAFAQDMSEELTRRSRERVTPAEGTRGGLSPAYFDKQEEDARREAAQADTPRSTE